jgi:hypothetical protein
MATRTIPVMTCDRCFVEVEVRRSGEDYEWGKIAAAQANGPLYIGGQYLEKEKAKDVCPSCMTALMSWWKAPIMENEKARTQPTEDNGR